MSRNGKNHAKAKHQHVWTPKTNPSWNFDCRLLKGIHLEMFIAAISQPILRMRDLFNEASIARLSLSLSVASWIQTTPIKGSRWFPTLKNIAVTFSDITNLFPTALIPLMPHRMQLQFPCEPGSVGDVKGNFRLKSRNSTSNQMPNADTQPPALLVASRIAHYILFLATWYVLPLPLCFEKNVS